MTFVGPGRELNKVKKLIVLAPTKSIEPSPRKKTKVQEIEEQDEETCECEDNADMQWLKFEGCLLTECDREGIVSKKLLTDRHISYAQSLLHHQFPVVEGLQNTLFQGKQHLKKINHGIQIIRDRENHWIVAYLKSSSKSVEVYDSVYITLHDGTARVILNLFDITDKMKIKLKKMQRQISSQDCGVFAIAVSTALLHNSTIDISKISFCQPQMREHLLTCFTANSLTPFPRNI